MSRVRNILATAAAIACAATTLALPAQAQCIPNPFPAAPQWLQQQEAAGGHTIARHVGKTDQQLINRVTAGRRAPRAAGSFPRPTATAQGTITAQLGQIADQINNWADNVEEGERRADDFVAAGTIGRVATRRPGGGADVNNTCTFRTVLEANGDGTCYLLTAFPTPAAGRCQ
jgi:hypothetical protein